MMTAPISSTSATSFAAELATLLIQTETSEEHSDSVERDSARATYLQDAQKQVDALHAAAGATAMGALVGAVFGLASSGCAFEAANTSGETACDMQILSKDLGELGGLTKSMTFDKNAENDKADAKRFETLAEQAKWEATDATTNLDKTDRLSGKILDILQSLNQDQNSATSAILGRV